MKKRIIKEEIEEIQHLWAEKIIGIGKAYSDGGDYYELADKMIITLYGYREGTVLFKPTKAKNRQFRMTGAGALSYFVGRNDQYPEDHGFALKPWKNVRFENAGFILGNSQAIAMGNYFFEDMAGNEIKVEYTLGFFRAEKGSLKINLHHSSLPYNES